MFIILMLAAEEIKELLHLICCQQVHLPLELDQDGSIKLQLQELVEVNYVISKHNRF